MAPKLIGEALTWATFTLKEYENVRIDEIIKTGIYNSLYVKKVLPAFTDCASFIRLPNRSRRCASLGSGARRLPGLLKLLAAGAETLEGSSLSALPCPRDCLTLPDILTVCPSPNQLRYLKGFSNLLISNFVKLGTNVRT